MAEEKFIKIQTLKNDGSAEGFSNSCLFIALYQYLVYSGIDSRVTVTQLRNEAKFTGEAKRDSMFLFDKKFNQFNEIIGDNDEVVNLNKMLIARGIKLRLYRVPRVAIKYTDSDGKLQRIEEVLKGRVTDMVQEFGDTSPRAKYTVNIVGNGMHFELIVTKMHGVEDQNIMRIIREFVNKGRTSEIRDYVPMYEVKKGSPFKTIDDARKGGRDEWKTAELAEQFSDFDSKIIILTKDRNWLMSVLRKREDELKSADFIINEIKNRRVQGDVKVIDNKKTILTGEIREFNSLLALKDKEITVLRQRLDDVKKRLSPYQGGALKDDYYQKYMKYKYKYVMLKNKIQKDKDAFAKYNNYI